MAPGFTDQVFAPLGRLPRSLSPAVRGRWSPGAAERLIHSFLVWAVGDNSGSDISDADVRNVIELVRAEASQEIDGAGSVDRMKRLAIP